jgi:23S rRNA pseudouridine955/2504/2580 synthase
MGDWQHGDMTVDAPLRVSHRQGGERHVVVRDDGKSAQTRVRLSRTYGKLSLLQCQPLTGRTHQIRVHLQHAGFPIAGDLRYGDEQLNTFAARAGLKRLFLHAQSIAFPDASGNELHFMAPLADDLQQFLNEGIDRFRRMLSG